MIVLNYGGGVNSTALLCEAVRRGVRVDVAVFADTGSEHPATMAYLPIAADFCRANDIRFDVVRWIRQDGTFLALHDWCAKFESLPSKAFGLPGCSVKWKQQPVDKHVRAMWDGGAPIERWLGFDAGEYARVERLADKDEAAWRWRAPLYEWNLDRVGCLRAVADAGLPEPPKSSCWLCPSMKPREVVALRSDHPDLHAAAVDLEVKAKAAGNLEHVVGLGRSWAWGDAAAKADARTEDQSCFCFDGDEYA